MKNLKLTLCNNSSSLVSKTILKGILQYNYFTSVDEITPINITKSLIIIITSFYLIKMINHKPILYVPIGIAGSGKSTLCKFIQRVTRNTLILEVDKFRLRDLPKTPNDEKPYKEDQEPIIRAFSLDLLAEYCRQRKNIIFDEINHTIDSRKELYNVVKPFGYNIYYIVFKRSVRFCKRFNSLRQRKVPNSVIERQSKELELPNDKKEYWDYILYLDNEKFPIFSKI